MEYGSYMLIKTGMAVHGTDGDLGTVSEVIADSGVDVFHGIVLAHGFLQNKHSFIAAEHIVSVDDNMVQVNMTKTDTEQLPPMVAGAGSHLTRGN